MAQITRITGISRMPRLTGIYTSMHDWDKDDLDVLDMTGMNLMTIMFGTTGVQ